MRIRHEPSMSRGLQRTRLAIRSAAVRSVNQNTAPAPSRCAGADRASPGSGAVADFTAGVDFS
jgi:hypothetical protein